jgi:hypothetical protein
MALNCSVCGKQLGRRNGTGRCKLHPSEATNALRGESMRRKFATDPEFRAKHKAKAGRQTEAGRKALSDRAKASGLAALGRAAITDETRQKMAATQRNRALSHIPSDYRDLYSELRNKYRVTVAEALAAVEQQQATDLARYRREMLR